MIALIKIIATSVSSRLLNKYTTKSLGFFGVLWLIYASFNNIPVQHAEFVAFAISNVSIKEIKEILIIINYVIIFALLAWIIYLAIDNLFRKSVTEPTIIMLILIKLFNINNKDNK